MIAEIAFGLVALLWVTLSARWIAAVRSVRHLPSLESIERPAAATPRVTAVIAARDERDRIETTVRRLLAQERLAIELVVVDDRSTDGTQRILQRLSQADPRLTVVTVDRLPEGWLGKCHALQRGGEVAQGDWILFTDADTWIDPDIVARAVLTAQRDAVEHLVLFPAQRGTRLDGKAAGLVFSSGLAGNALDVNRDRRRAFVGVGAFNLVRADAWRAIGGHAPLRLEVCDDMKLGLLLRRAGKRSRAYNAGYGLEVHWATTAWGLVRALEKNLFAMLGYHLPLTVVAVASSLALWLAAIAGPWSGSVAGFAACVAWLSLIVPARMVCVRAGWGWAPALLVPPFFPILAVALARSAWLTLRRGGVRWRETFYPLAELKRGVVPLPWF